MDPVLLLMVKVDGTWDNDYNFNCRSTFAMQVLFSANYTAFMEQLSSIFSPYKSNNHFNLSYIVDGCPPPISIHDEETFRFYLYLKSLQTDFQKSPLCVEFLVDQPVARPVVSCPTNSVAQTVLPEIPCFLNQSSGHIRSSFNSIEEHYVQVNNEVNVTDTSQTHMTNTDVLSCSPTPEVSSTPSPSSMCNDNFSVHHNLDVITHYHPTQIVLHAIYNSKAGLLHHLKLYAIDNVFQFRTLTSKKKCLHVICLDKKCKWAVRAVRLRGVQMFQIQRYFSITVYLVNHSVCLLFHYVGIFSTFFSYSHF
ncbi:unnamed protein product [Cuscuta europaea]|uniref:Transposase MuDR plant domain-containing protein n=1 Tax=Cuscuta europaea TaxID=41803 RepID=A0A9P1E110_CUSEU|nr:unnamed protein product [Cuscuta europaea]